MKSPISIIKNKIYIIFIKFNQNIIIIIIFNIVFLKFNLDFFFILKKI
jgi:hypothetical protein